MHAQGDSSHLFKMSSSSCMLCCPGHTSSNVLRQFDLIRVQISPGEAANIAPCLQVCATIGLCDTHQIPSPARKLLAQTLMQAQQTQQDQIPSEMLRQIIPAEQRTAQHAQQGGESTQCQICEMAVNYVKVRMLTNKVLQIVCVVSTKPKECHGIPHSAYTLIRLL